MSFALFGFILVWITFPFLAVLTIFTRTINDNYALYAVTLNMFLAMASSVLGTFTACSFLFKNFSINELVFTGTAVLIIYYIFIEPKINREDDSMEDQEIP